MYKILVYFKYFKFMFYKYKIFNYCIIFPLSDRRGIEIATVLRIVRTPLAPSVYPRSDDAMVNGHLSRTLVLRLRRVHPFDFPHVTRRRRIPFFQCRRCSGIFMVVGF